MSRDRAGLFGNLTRAAGAWDLEAGLRYNRVRMDAGEVSGDLAIMPGSPMVIQQLRLDELAAELALLLERGVLSKQELVAILRDAR